MIPLYESDKTRKKDLKIWTKIPHSDHFSEKVSVNTELSISLSVSLLVANDHHTAEEDL